MELLKSPEFPFTNSSAGINGVEDDYTEIEFLKDFVASEAQYKYGHLLLNTFEESVTRNYFKVTYHKVTSDGNLDGRVSSVRIAFPHREGEK